jgi:hypothetical protein
MFYAQCIRSEESPIRPWGRTTNRDGTRKRRLVGGLPPLHHERLGFEGELYAQALCCFLLFVFPFSRRLPFVGFVLAYTKLFSYLHKPSGSTAFHI